MISAAIENQILECEHRLTKAELHADESALESLLSDDFKGVNHRGMRVNKRNFIFGMCRAGVGLKNLEIADLEMVIEEQMVIVYGKSMFDLVVNEETVHGSTQYIDIWRKIDGEWKLQVSSVTPMK